MTTGPHDGGRPSCGRPSPEDPAPSHAPSHAASQRRGRLRLAALLALIAALAIGGYALPLRRIPDAVGHMGAVAPLAGIGAGTLLLCALIPRTAVSLACGLLFGAVAGGAIALAAAVLAASATFAIGRALGRDAVVALGRAHGRRSFRSRPSGSPDTCSPGARAPGTRDSLCGGVTRAIHRPGPACSPRVTHSSRHACGLRGIHSPREGVARLDAWLARRGLWGVTLVRMTPLAPFGVIGYAYGATSVRWRNYLGGTAIGATPSAFSYAGLGAAAVRPDAVRWVTFAPATVGLLIAVATFVYWRRRRPPQGEDR